MALDFWTDYYYRRPKDASVQEYESDDFEADVAAMLAEDEFETIETTEVSRG
jgi:hypothetical protein